VGLRVVREMNGMWGERGHAVRERIGPHSIIYSFIYSSIHPSIILNRKQEGIHSKVGERRRRSSQEHQGTP
jgi:hypothetical protein